jgi:glycosyltransferase involved in cell wall biosynthesis
MSKISAVIIVKNEEVMLPKMLDSIKGVDEIIICDTGSSDKTVEIAEKYVGKGNVKFKQWNDNFAEARNYAKSFATGDWILSIDADEYLHDLSEVRKAVAIAEEKGVNAINVAMISDNFTAQTFYFPRVFKNDPEVYWLGAVHNHLTIQKGEDVGNIKITYGFSPAHLLDKDRALRTLKKEVNEKGGAREIFYLAREYFQRQMWGEAIDMFEKYLKKEAHYSEKAEAYLLLGYIYFELKEMDKARDNTLQAIGINSNFKEAVLFMVKLAGDGLGNPVWQKHADQWKRMAETADNSEVLFIRDVEQKLFLSPHDDDASLFGAYTCMRNKPVVCVVTDSYIQHNRGEIGCDWKTRAMETKRSCDILGVTVSRLGIRDDAINEEILRHKLKKIKGFGVVYAPAIQGGNPIHDMVGKIAKEVFGNKVVFYTTYTKTEPYTKGNTEVIPTKEEMALKEKALLCFISQIKLPSTRPYFMENLGKSEWYI